MSEYGHLRVDVFDKREAVGYLRLDLVRHAENVGVILLETPHASEAGEGPGRLVAVQDAEVGEPQREVAVAPHLR